MFITLTELKLYFNKRIIISVIVLALLSLIVGLLGDDLLYKTKLVPEFTMLIVDNDKSQESRLLLSTLAGYEAETMTVEIAEYDAAKQAVEQGRAAAALVLPKGFFADIMSGKNSDASLLVNNENPIVDELVSLFANSIKEELAASQAGIYAVLSHSDSASYQKYMMDININFMSIFAGRSFESEVVSPFGSMSKKDYYSFTFYMFAMFLISCLFIDKGNIIKDRDVFQLLKAKGTGIYSIYRQKLLSVLLVYSALNVPIFALLGYFGMFKGLGFLAVLMLFLLLSLCQSSFCNLFIWCFSSVRNAGIFIFIFELATLFFSGGVLPLVFLPDALKQFSYFTANYNFFSLLSALKIGAFDKQAFAGILAICVVCYLLALVFAFRTANAKEVI